MDTQKERASIIGLIKNNPSGLLELQPSLTIPEYRENYGFDLKNTCKIYESKYANHNNQDWFAFNRVPLNELFKVRAESDGDLLVVFIAEVMKQGKIFCYLILSDEAFATILNDRNQHLLKVHQMYTKFFSSDHIALNTKKAAVC